MSEPQVSRGHVALARAIAAAGLTRQEAGKRAEWDPGHIGKVLSGRAPGGVAMGKATLFVPDLNLWRQAASDDEREEMRRFIASIDAMSKQRRARS